MCAWRFINLCSSHFTDYYDYCYYEHYPSFLVVFVGECLWLLIGVEWRNPVHMSVTSSLLMSLLRVSVCAWQWWRWRRLRWNSFSWWPRQRPRFTTGQFFFKFKRTHANMANNRRQYKRAFENWCKTRVLWSLQLRKLTISHPINDWVNSDDWKIGY